MATRTAVAPVVKVNGNSHAAADIRLAEMRVRRTLHGAGSASFGFRVRTLATLTSADYEMGKTIEVYLPQGASTLKQVFKGEIVSIGFDSLGGAQQNLTLRVEARDASHRLASASEFKAYLNQKRSQVASAIAGRHSLTFSGDSDDAQIPYLVQTGSDHAMLTEMARELGWEWFTDDDKLCFRKRPTTAGVTLKPDDDELLAFSVQYTGTPVASDIKMYGWNPEGDPVAAAAGAVIASPSAAHLGTTAPFVTSQYAKAKSAFGKPLEIAAAPTNSTEVATRAKAAATDLVGRGLHAQGQCVANPDLAPGTMLTIENLHASVNGDYYLTSVTHDFAASVGVRTSFESSGHHLEPAPDDLPAGGSPWGRMGLAVGKVTNLEDPKALGRVKVKFPVLGDVAESDWAFVVSPGAGKDRGIDFRPEMNDQVVVGFEAGNPRQAFVLGGIWSADRTLPDPAAVDGGDVRKRVIRSRLGHKIVLGDGQGDPDKGVLIELANGTKLDLNHDHGLLETAKKFTIKANGSEIEFGDNGALTIKSSSLKLETQQAAEIKSGTNLDLKGGANVKLEATANLDVKAGAMGKFEAGAPLTLKGAIVQVN